MTDLNPKWTPGPMKATIYPVPVIVCGGRTHAMTDDEEEILLSLLHWLSFRCHASGIVVWHGAAEGVDRQAAKLASKHGFATEAFRPAQGELDFLSPTLARNEEMASRARQRGGGYVIAMPGGTGTDDMVQRGWRHQLHILDLRSLLREVPGA